MLANVIQYMSNLNCKIFGTFWIYVVVVARPTNVWTGFSDCDCYYGGDEGNGKKGRKREKEKEIAWKTEKTDRNGQIKNGSHGERRIGRSFHLKLCFLWSCTPCIRMVSCLAHMHFAWLVPEDDICRDLQHADSRSKGEYVQKAASIRCNVIPWALYFNCFSHSEFATRRFFSSEKIPRSYK